MKKLAIFDVDWTIIKPKDDRTFPKNKDDWQYLTNNVPLILKSYENQGYQLVFLTDQTKNWKIEMINDIIKDLNLNIIPIISMSKVHINQIQVYLIRL